MPNPNPAIEQLALAIEELPALLERFLPGFDDSNRAAQAPGLPNHVVWTLGHLALNDHRAAERIEAREPGPLPERDFVTGDGSAGDATRFDTESVCFNSAPSPDAARFPTLARALEIHAAAAARLARAVRTLDAASCARPVAWGAGAVPTTAAALASRMIHHTGVHVGQVLDLRRALGMPRVIA